MVRILNKRLQSIIAIVILGLAALAGVLLLMGWLSAPKTAPVAQVEPAPEKPAQAVQAEAQPAEAAATTQEGIEETVATINETTISRQVWRRATRLDAVMSKMAFQPVPTAEETLDRLVNEVLVLDGADSVAEPSAEEVAGRIESLAALWNVSGEAIDTALAEASLSRDDLTRRVARLIQVEAAINQLSTRETDLNRWLLDARAAAEIGLYRSLANNAQNQDAQENLPPPVTDKQPEPAMDSEAHPESGPQPEAETEVAQAEIAPPPDLPVSPYPSNLAPDFTLPGLNGDSIQLSSLRGKPVIINFWATWCPPCRRELPALQSAFDSYGDKIGFVAVDVKESREKVDAFIKELNLDFPVALDPEGQVSNSAYEVRGLPTTIFVDAAGVVSARHLGPVDEALIDQYLAPLLEPPAATVEQPATEDESALSMIGPEGESGASGVEGEPDAADSPEDVTAELAGEAAPDFVLTSGTGNPVSLQDYRDESNVVLVFYRGYT